MIEFAIHAATVLIKIIIKVMIKVDQGKRDNKQTKKNISIMKL